MRRRNGRWLIALLLVTATSGACSKSAKSYYDSGNQYYDQKKYKEAIVEYSNAIKKDPKFGDAYFKRAESYSQTGDLGGAYRDYVRAADELPKSKEAQLKAGAFLLMAAQWARDAASAKILFEDAKTRAQAALDLDPNYVDALIVRANATANISKDINSAVNDIEEAIKIDPTRSGSYLSLGGFEEARGDATKAEADFRRAVELDRKSLPARLALANFYIRSNRGTDAEGALKEALALDPKNEQVNMALAGYYIRSGQWKEAESFLQTAADTTGNWRAALALADYYVAGDRVPDAIARLDAVAGQSKEKGAYAEARTRLAAIQYSQKKQAEAHQTLAEVLTKEPNSVGTLLLDARFFAAEKKFDEALERARRATAAEPDNASARYTLGTILAGKGDVDEAIKEYTETLRISPRAVLAQVELARAHLSRGAVDTAVQFAQQAVQNEPGNDQARLVLVRALLAKAALQGKDDKESLARADAELKPLVAKYPEVASVQAELGTLLMGRGDLAGSRRAFDKALQIDPMSYQALAGLVSLDVAAKKPADARARIDARLAKAPNDQAALLLSARLYSITRELDRAEQTLLKLIQAEPGSLQGYQDLAQIYLLQKNYPQALAKFEELAKRQPKPVAAQTMIAMILQGQGKVDEAQRRYELVLEIDPRAAVAANNLAWLYAEGRGNLDTALQLARTAKEQLPDLPQVNDTLGWIYVKKGLSSLAIPLLSAAVTATEKAEQNDQTRQALATYLYHLGIAYRDAKKTADAKVTLEKALKLNPNFDGSAEARKVLAEIG